MAAIETLVDGLDHPEGVAWDREAEVVWAGGEEGQLYRVDVERRTFVEVVRAPGLALGVAVGGRGRVALCCPGARSLSVWDGHELRPVVTSGLAFPNFAAFAPDGMLYFSDSGTWSENDGRLLRLDTDGTVDVVSDAVCHFTNGCAGSPDGRSLWVVESYVPNVTRFDLTTGGSELVTRLDGTVL